jgi:hypothetical protein
VTDSLGKHPQLFTRKPDLRRHTGLSAFTFLCEKPDFFGRKTVLPTAWRREERKTFFGKHFSAHASLNNRRTLSMAKSRPRRQNLEGYELGLFLSHSSTHGLFSSGLGCRNYLFTTAPWYVLMDEGIKHISLAGGVYSNSTGKG